MKTRLKDERERMKAARACAFTLTELLVVIALIVLILGLAVPAFNLISGSGSIDQAQNQIATMLAQAQATAIARENCVGVLFYKDTAADRTALALVEKVKPSPWVSQKPTADGTFVTMKYYKGDVVSRVTTLTTAPPTMDGEPLGVMTRYYIANRSHDANSGNGPNQAGGVGQEWTLIKPHTLMLVADQGEAGAPPTFRERVLLPKNVQVQFPFEPQPWGIGTKYYRNQRIAVYAAANAPPTIYACASEHVSTAVPAPGNRPPNATFWTVDPNIERYMGMGVVMFDPSGKPVFDTRGGFTVERNSELGLLFPTIDAAGFPFLYGRTDFVMFDQEAFRGAGHDDEDPMITGTGTTADETAEETWLDENATLLLVHKYRGTLGRAE